MTGSKANETVMVMSNPRWTSHSRLRRRTRQFPLRLPLQHVPLLLPDHASRLKTAK